MGDGLTKYTLASKHTWRRWAWNQVASRALSRGTVVYLLGPDPVDWKVAKDVRIGRDRLLGISVDRDHVATARASGLYASHGSLVDVLLAWPSNEPLAAVVADTCSVLGNHLEVLLRAIVRQSMRAPMMVVVNVQRGREDAETSDRIRHCARYHGGLADHSPHHSLNGDLKHRGLYVFQSWSDQVDGYGWNDPRAFAVPPGASLNDLWSCGVTDESIELWSRWSRTVGTASTCAARPRYASYQSNKVTMDSVAFVSQFNPPEKWKQLAEQDPGLWRLPSPGNGVSGRLAAWRAVRTMNRRAT